MKSIKTLSYIFAATLFVMGLSSCDKVDYPDRFRPTSGVPTVHSVRYSSTDTYIDQAFMEEVVCILGENLRSVHDVWFNDQQAILNTSYVTDNTLMVQVPKTMPTVETDKIYLITAAKDTVTYDFRVLPPVPSVREMSFEYAQPGEFVTIYGNYFYQKEGGEPMVVEFPGAKATEIKNLTMTSFDVKVPAGAQPGKVRVTTASGTSASDFYYADNRGLLFDFDGTNGLYTINHGWHACDLTAEGQGVGGSVALIASNGEQEFTANGEDWQDGKCHFEYWAGNWQDPETYGTWDGRRLIDLVDFTNFASMCIKFEVKVDPERPWTGCPMQIIFSSVTQVSNGNAGVLDIHGNVLAGCNNTYFAKDKQHPRYMWRPWKTAEGGVYSTNNQWVTVTVPFTAFTDNMDGTPATGTLTPESFSNLEFFFAGGTSDEGKPCKPYILIDNVRAVPVR
ncbi:MAG: glycan-binding surface protein [Bacteroidales bacterium]|nr:glycan-binding surface protein [Bacteroidales bacterium]